MNPTQLAAEAWAKIKKLKGSASPHIIEERSISIIQTSIEKATGDIRCQYDASQDALKEVMGELTECRKEHAILFRRLTKSRATQSSEKP